MVTLLVLWVVALAGIVVAAVQSAAYSEAAAGREALSRVRAYWAARAGVEATIARLEYATVNPDTSDAFTILDDMADLAEGTLADAAYQVSHAEAKRDVLGPADAHAKININLMTREALMTLPYMSEDIADAVLDWIDPDDDTNPMGAEVGYYGSLPRGYEPRNGPFQSIQELELVAGVYPEFVRGEDWNLNGRLDPNEDDGDLSWPPDNADGVLDAGWSGIITASSVTGTLAPSGKKRLDLMTAKDGDVAARTGVSSDQAKVIVDYAQMAQGATMADFLRSDLRTLAQRVTGGGGGGGGGGSGQASVPALSNEQLAALLNETGIYVDAMAGFEPGKLNINTAVAEQLQYLPSIDPALADSIIFERGGRPKGFTSIMDLAEVPGISRRRLATLYSMLDVRSSVYVVTSRGRDTRTGLEVEITATLDRSVVPVVIREIVVR